MYIFDKINARSIAVMQPYFFPYIGYFQLLYRSDVFVFYDDVNFIKQGWINRNRVLINNEARYLTIPCQNISQHVLIKNIEHSLDERMKNKLLKKIRLAYQSAPFFPSVFPLFEKVLDTEASTISELASRSIKDTCSYLQIKTNFKFSSQSYSNTGLHGEDRIIDICRRENAGIYFNSMGGKGLYNEECFASQGIMLKFLKPRLIPYGQFNNTFIPGLSIIDVMMFNDPVHIKNMLQVHTDNNKNIKRMNSYSGVSTLNCQT